MGGAPATGKGSLARLFVKNVTVYMLVNYREVYVRGMQPRTQGLSLGKTLASAGHVIPRIWDFLNKNIYGGYVSMLASLIFIEIFIEQGVEKE